MDDQMHKCQGIIRFASNDKHTLAGSTHMPNIPYFVPACNASECSHVQRQIIIKSVHHNAVHRQNI